MAGDLNLSNLQPAQPRKDRKRVGRGLGSGKGRYSGRGIKGQKSRAGSHTMRAGFEGGQMPLAHAHRQAARQHVEGRDADRAVPHVHASRSTSATSSRFEAGEEVTPEALKAKGLIRSIRKDVKLLGVGELTKKLTITVHGASATAREKIEAAGGTLTLLKEPKARKPKNTKRRPGGPDAQAPRPRRRRGDRADGRRGRRPCSPGSPTPGGSRSSGAGSSSPRSILAAYRLGSWMPAPGVDSQRSRTSSTARAARCSAC